MFSTKDDVALFAISCDISSFLSAKRTSGTKNISATAAKIPIISVVDSSIKYYPFFLIIFPNISYNSFFSFIYFKSV